MVLSYLRGLSSESELNRTIAKLVKLDAKPVSKLAQSRWILSEGVIIRLLKTARKALKAKPALLRDVPSPCIVVGDLHGDILTLIRILKHNGMPPKANYLFLGDYVDRGSNGVEVLALILALHCRHPSHVNCLRGNHESIMMSRAYGFLSECRTRYSTRIYTASIAVFNVLPIAAIVGGTVFAVHGGITPRLGALEDINAIPRPAKLEPDTLLADLIWGDPVVNTGVQDYADSDRGAGHLFGRRAYTTFLERHGFLAMVRAHEVCRRGCRRAFGTCWTVFSHPQYLGLANAAGALVIHADSSFEPQAFAVTPEDLEALADHPLDAEDEEAGETVPRCVESVMLDAVDSTERAAVIAELDVEILGLQVGSTSTSGSEQFETVDGEGPAGLRGKRPVSAPGLVHTPATSDVQTLSARDGSAAGHAVPSTFPPRGLSAAGTLGAGVAAPPCAISPASCGDLHDSPRKISVMVSASSAQAASKPIRFGGTEAAATPPASSAGPPSGGSSRAASPRHIMQPATTPAVAIAPRTATAGALLVKSTPDDSTAMSGSPASVAYALAARAGLPTALARPLTAHAGHTFGKVVSPAATGSLTTPDTAEMLQFPLRGSPAAASQPLLLAIGSQTDLASPLQVSAPSSAGAGVPPRASGAASVADNAGPRVFVPPAANGACEVSIPGSPSVAPLDELPALPEGKAVALPPAEAPAAGAALLKVVAYGRSTSGSVEGGDSAGMGRDTSMNVSAATLAATSGITDEQEAAVC